LLNDLARGGTPLRRTCACQRPRNRLMVAKRKSSKSLIHQRILAQRCQGLSRQISGIWLRQCAAIVPRRTLLSDGDAERPVGSTGPDELALDQNEISAAVPRQRSFRLPRCANAIFKACVVGGRGLLSWRMSVRCLMICSDSSSINHDQWRSISIFNCAGFHADYCSTGARAGGGQH
jgi:hypothetical protein